MGQRIASLGASHPDTVSVMNNLATVWLTMGESKKAEQLYKRALQAIGDHAEAIPIRYNLALIHADDGQPELAERELRAVINDAGQFLGRSDSPSRSSTADVLKWRNMLARVLHDQGKTEAARDLYARILDQQRELLGPSHRHTLSTHRRLTRLLVELGEFEEVLPLLQDCLNLHNEKYGTARGHTIDVRKALADALIGLNRFDEADAFLRETVEIVSTERGEDHEYTAEVKADLEEYLESRGE